MSNELESSRARVRVAARICPVGYIRYSERERESENQPRKMFNARKFSIFLYAFPFCTESTVCAATVLVVATAF